MEITTIMTAQTDMSVTELSEDTTNQPEKIQSAVVFPTEESVEFETTLRTETVDQQHNVVFPTEAALETVMPPEDELAVTLDYMETTTSVHNEDDIERMDTTTEEVKEIVRKVSVTKEKDDMENVEGKLNENNGVIVKTVAESDIDSLITTISDDEVT